MSEKEKHCPSVAEIESAVNKVLAASKDGSFPMRKVLNALHGGESKALINRILRYLDGEGKFFAGENDTFQRKADFFRNYSFVITPDSWEIENGLLIPGHRFAPFVSADVFPSEVEIDFRKYEISAPVDKLFHYLYLLGTEQMFDYLLAEHSANSCIRGGLRSGAPAPVVTVNVFDLRNFYRENEFCEGDALKVTVLDYESGKCQVEYLSGSDRSASGCKKSVAELDAAIKKAADAFDDYLELPDEFAYAYFCRGKALDLHSEVSLDEYICRSEKVELTADGGVTVLRWRDPEKEYAEDLAEAPGLPEGISISKGETSTPEAMLRELGSTLTSSEIDGFILDNCSTYALEFDEFFSRAFGKTDLDFADEGQRAVFMNYLEDRFEDLSGSYNRIDDENKAPLRAMIMELVEDRIEFLHELSNEEEDHECGCGCGHDHDHDRHEMFHKLAAIAGQLNELLKLLNDPAYTPSEEECAKIRSMIEQRIDDQEAIINSNENGEEI